MAKAGSNIYRRKDGRYEGRILMEKSVCQKPKYVYVYARTLREVKQKMKEVKRENSVDRDVWNMRLSEGAEEWMQEKRGEWKVTTYDAYQRVISRYIEPILGQYKIRDIGKKTMDGFSREIVKMSENGHVSEKYKKYICSIVCQIVEYESRLHQLDARQPGLPDFRVLKKETELPSDKDLALLETYLLHHLHEDTCLGILVAKCTGIRIGELCALQWRDIDLERGMVTISRNLQRVVKYGEEAETEEGTTKTKVCLLEPKTMNSVRRIPLADGLVEILKLYQREPERYLISGQKSEWAEVRTVQYRFNSILKKCGVKPFRFHLLRHAFASRCVGQGCDIKSLSEVLGHSSVQITMNIYVHSSMQQKKDMVNLACKLKE